MSGTIPQRRLQSFPAFNAYRAELITWLGGRATDEGALYRAGLALCDELRAAGSFPEHILMELQGLALKPDRRDLPQEDAAGIDARYMHAIELLLRSCYGDAPRLRAVRGADGRHWIVLLVQEGMRWDPEIEMRRKDWLSCVAQDDRRYLTPVPPGWSDWADAELMTRILRAPVDLRGPPMK